MAVADTGSTDRTSRFSRADSASIPCCNPWKSRPATPSRPAATSPFPALRTDWVLCLDADERVERSALATSGPDWRRSGPTASSAAGSPTDWVSPSRTTSSPCFGQDTAAWAHPRQRADRPAPSRPAGRVAGPPGGRALSRRRGERGQAPAAQATTGVRHAARARLVPTPLVHGLQPVPGGAAGRGRGLPADLRGGPVGCVSRRVAQQPGRAGGHSRAGGDGEGARDRLESALRFHVEQADDFEVRVNFRLGAWLRRAADSCARGALDEIRAYRFAY